MSTVKGPFLRRILTVARMGLGSREWLRVEGLWFPGF